MADKYDIDQVFLVKFDASNQNYFIQRRKNEYGNILAK